jgi:hypothetical protein
MFEADMPWQMTFPEASVVRALEPEQLATVESWKPPAFTSTPPAKVEVPAPWENIWPPVSTKPFAEASPPAERPDDIPPAKVEVAVEEAWIGLFNTLSPPRNSEVRVVEVAVMKPKAGEVEAEVVKVWVEPEEEIDKTFQSFEVLTTEKVCVPAVSPFRELIPPTQVPLTAKQPAEISKPEAKVEVPAPVWTIRPPVRVRPCDDANPPPPTETPPVKVEVPVPPTSNTVLEACKGAPDTVRPPTTVEEACERKAEERVARPEN